MKLKNVDAETVKTGDDALRLKVLDTAMNLFWTRGAEVASYNEIVEATGLSRKALYHYWPDKSALVQDTLEHYRANMLSGLIAPLQEAGAEGLAKFWDNLETAAQSKNWCGCYLYRTAGGPLRSESFVASILTSYLDELGQAFTDAILHGQRDGDIDTSIDAELAGVQSVALIGMISDIGAQAGYNARVNALFAAVRATAGLSSTMATGQN